jgi:hypothetical protein
MNSFHVHWFRWAGVPMAALLLVVAALAFAQPATAEKGPPVTGSVRGTISYPGGSAPRVTVVAYGEDGLQMWVRVPAGETSYAIAGLPAGRYELVAYAKGSGIAGAYTGCDYASLTVDCVPGETTTIYVPAGANLAQIDITSWRSALLYREMPDEAHDTPRPPAAGSGVQPTITDEESFAFYGAAAALLALGVAGVTYAALGGRLREQ